MKKLVFAAFATLSMVVLADGPAQNRPAPGGNSDPLVQAMLNRKIVDKLNLSAEQQSELKSQMGDQNEVRELQERLRTTTQQLNAIQKRRREAVRKVLTPEQMKTARAEFAEVVKAREAARAAGEGGKPKVAADKNGPKPEAAAPKNPKGDGDKPRCRKGEGDRPRFRKGEGDRPRFWKGEGDRPRFRKGEGGEKADRKGEREARRAARKAEREAARAERKAAKRADKE